MKNQKTFLQCAFFVGAFLLFSLNAQSQATTFNGSESVIIEAHTVYNDCTGEDVYFPEGNAHISYGGVIKPNGTIRTRFHGNWNLVGYGEDSGTIYQCVSPYNESSVGTLAGQEGSFWFIQHMFSHGGGNGSNMLATIHGTFMVDAEGNHEITSFDVEIGCSGQ
jgi:hypothetical protein